MRRERMATQQPGNMLTIVSGAWRGLGYIHEQDLLEKTVDSPVPVSAFKVRLVTEEGEEEHIYPSGSVP